MQRHSLIECTYTYISIADACQRNSLMQANLHRFYIYIYMYLYMYINCICMHVPWLEELELCNVLIAKHSNHLGKCAQMVGGIAMLAGTGGSDGWTTTHVTRTTGGAAMLCWRWRCWLERCWRGHGCFEGDSLYMHVCTCQTSR